MNKQEKLSVIIPVFNEERTIESILRALTSLVIEGIDLDVLVVNDGSTDRTRAEVDEFVEKNPTASVRLFNQLKNMGKGAAIRRGIGEATGDYLVVQDADLEYDPKEFTELLAPLRNGAADVVY